MRLSLVLLLAALAETRVTFDKSEVLDNVDLKGTNTQAAFRCSSGCRVYSPTKNDNIEVTDSNFKKWTSLGDLSRLAAGYDLPAGQYKLINNGLADPPFVFYAVEKGAANYNTKVQYVNAGSQLTLDAKSDFIFTVMSSSGAVRVSNFAGDFSDVLPTVHATGSDAATSPSCKPVYSASSTSSLPLTAFPVNSPIATINFKKTGAGKSVVVSGDTNSDRSTMVDSRAVFVSPGYVGCSTVGDSLYTFLPRVISIDSTFYVKDSNGVTVTASGVYTIADTAYPLTFGFNDDVKKLTGTSSISQSEEGTTVKVQVSWSWREDSKDRFALQIDMASKAASGGKTTKKTDPGVPTTTRSANNHTNPNGQTTPKVNPTTSSVQPLGLIVSCVIISCYFSTR